MSDYPMLISNKLHSFRNFAKQGNENVAINSKHPIFLNVFILCLIFSNVNIEGIIGCNKSVYGQPSFYMDKIISQLL